MNHQQEKFANKNLATNQEIGSLSPDFPAFKGLQVFGQVTEQIP